MRTSLLPLSKELPSVNRRIAPLCALAHRHQDELNAFSELDARANGLAELNVPEQVSLLRQSPVISDADAPPLVHGWIFGLHDGLLKVLASAYDDDSARAAPPMAHADMREVIEAAAR